MTTEQSAYLADKLGNQDKHQHYLTILKEFETIKGNLLDYSILYDTPLDTFIYNSIGYNYKPKRFRNYKLILNNCDLNDLNILNNNYDFIFYNEKFWKYELNENYYFKIFNNFMEIKINFFKFNKFLETSNNLIKVKLNNFYKSYILKGLINEYVNKIKTVEITLKYGITHLKPLIEAAFENYNYNIKILNKLNGKRVDFNTLFVYKLNGRILTAKNKKDSKIMKKYILNLNSLIGYNILFILIKDIHTGLWDININDNILTLTKLTYYTYKKYENF